MLSPEEIIQIKKQIVQQIDSTFPEDKKESAKQQIRVMNSKQLEEFLEKNKLISENGTPSQNQCIFCSIVSGNAQSYKIDENEKAIAVLEINPVSKGHILIIPKEHLSSKEELPNEVNLLSKEITKRIKAKLKPKDIQISSSNVFGHEIVNIFPIYENETINSQRSQAKQEELENLQSILKKELKKEVIKKSKIEKINSEKMWLPKRIP